MARTDSLCIFLHNYAAVPSLLCGRPNFNTYSGKKDIELFRIPIWMVYRNVDRAVSSCAIHQHPLQRYRDPTSQDVFHYHPFFHHIPSHIHKPVWTACFARILARLLPTDILHRRSIHPGIYTTHQQMAPTVCYPCNRYHTARFLNDRNARPHADFNPRRLFRSLWRTIRNSHISDDVRPEVRQRHRHKFHLLDLPPVP